MSAAAWTTRDLRSVGLLTTPILVWNVACARYLPEPFTSPAFDDGIPPLLLLSEQVLRMAVFVLPFFMPLEFRTVTQRRGASLFVAGTVVYVAAWVPLMVAPAASWSTSRVGFLAPAYTPALWLIGLGLVGGGHLGPWRLKRWVYPALVCAFVTMHVAHVNLVYGRAHGAHDTSGDLNRPFAADGRAAEPAREGVAYAAYRYRANVRGPQR